MSTVARIGKSTTTAIGFGAMSIGSPIYGKKHDSKEDRVKLLQGIFDAGERNWDTSDVYGESEEVIGTWLKQSGKRDDIFLATKFGIPLNRSDSVGVRGDAEYVQQAFQRSHSRLGTHVDLYYLHRPDPKTPIETTVGAMKKLVEEGKVKYLGLSEVTVNDIRRAHAVHPISALQIEYSPFTLFTEKPGGHLDVCKELGITVIAYSPTGRGLLTGSIRSPDDLDEDDWRRNVPKYSKENFVHIVKLVDGLNEIAKARNATSAQVCLAWLVAQSNLPNRPEIVPIPGTKRLEYALENLKALQVRLTEADLKKIRELVDATETALGGAERYPSGMAWHLQDTPPLK